MKHHSLSGFDIVAIVLVVLGAINLGLEGIFQYPIIQSILGNEVTLVRIIYAFIGIAGIWLIYLMMRCCGKDKHHK